MARVGKKRLEPAARFRLALGGTLFGILIAVIVGEAAIRISLNRDFRKQARQFNLSPGFDYLLCPEEAIGYRLKPDRTITPGKGILYTIGAGAFRSHPRSGAPDENGATVLFLGDSFTFGYGVNDAETFPFFAEQRLRESGLAARCVNLGVIGYNLVQYREALLENIPRFKPEVVVMTVYVNDAEPTNPGVVPVNPAETFRDVRLWSYHELASQWDLPNRKRVDGDPLASFAEGSPKRADAGKAFRDVVRICADRGLRLLVVSAPLALKSDFSGNYKYEPVQRLFAEWAGSQDAPLLDLREAILAAELDPESLVIPNDGHFSVKGNAFVAGKIVERIRPWLEAGQADRGGKTP